MRGWCPFAERRPTNNYGYPQGMTGQNQPLLFTDHTMGGWKRTLDNASWREPNGVGVHFGLGRDGSASQYTNIFDASWANGVAGSVAKFNPRKNPRLAQLEKTGTWKAVSYAGTTAFALVNAGVNVLNTRCISFEHEDEGVLDRAWTPEMTSTSIRIKRWCLDELAAAGMPMEVDEWMLAGHFEIDGVHRVHCPGAGYPREEILEALMDAPTKAEFGELYKYVERVDAGVKFLIATTIALAGQVFGDDDPRTKDLKQRVDELEAKG